MNASNRHRSLWPIVLCCAFIAMTAFAFRAGAQGGQSARPVTLGLINIEKVINTLDELKDLQTRVDGVVATRRKLVDDMSSQVEKMQGEIRLMPEGSAQRIAKSRELQELTFKLRVETEVAVAIIDSEKGGIYADLFRKITESSQRFAERNGFDMILSSDAIAETPRGGTEAQIKGFIVSRRVIFNSPSIDVTDQLITMMNNEYKSNANARQNAVGAGAANANGKKNP
jgi:outer membrane protein